MTHQELQLKIMRLCNINEMHYAEIVFEYGIAFLEHYTGGDHWAVNQLSQTKSYWNWYKQQWFVIDKVFYEYYAVYEGHIKSERMLHIWLEEHGAKKITAYPPSELFHSTYSQMFDQAVKEVSHE